VPLPRAGPAAASRRVPESGLVLAELPMENDHPRQQPPKSILLAARSPSSFSSCMNDTRPMIESVPSVSSERKNLTRGDTKAKTAEKPAKFQLECRCSGIEPIRGICARRGQVVISAITRQMATCGSSLRHPQACRPRRRGDDRRGWWERRVRRAPMPRRWRVEATP
jgi:hypothetical protein